MLVSTNNYVTYVVGYLCLLFKGPIVYKNSAYGDGEYPIVMYAISCYGWEKSVTDCTHISYEFIGKCSRQPCCWSFVP